MITIVLLAVGGAIIAAVVGTFWYSGMTPMGKLHMRALGFDTLSVEEQKKKMEEAKPKMKKMYAGQMALSFLTAFSVVFVMITGIRNGLSPWLALGFVIMNWLCFIVPTIGSGILWSNCDRTIAWKKFFSDILSNLVTVLLTALLASLVA
ncbi:MAG: hypothetical protein RLZZ347_437 [Candidatus Parcubacteria bacterium]|jgi:hypothetical protein